MARFVMAANSVMTNAAQPGTAPSNTRRASLYLRVSTASKTKCDKTAFNQNPAVQEQPLRDLIAQRGWQLHRVYSDRASAAKERRPGLDALMADARRGAFDVVLVFRFDRFARSVKQLVSALEEFQLLGIDFISHQEALDTSTPMGKAMFTIIGAMAELERSVVRERVVGGMEYARARGTKSGKPIGRPRAIFRRDQAQELRDRGESWRQIARELGVSVATVRRACQDRGGPCNLCQNPRNTVCNGFWLSALCSYPESVNNSLSYILSPRTNTGLQATHRLSPKVQNV